MAGGLCGVGDGSTTFNLPRSAGLVGDAQAELCVEGRAMRNKPDGGGARSAQTRQKRQLSDEIDVAIAVCPTHGLGSLVLRAAAPETRPRLLAPSLQK